MTKAKLVPDWVRFSSPRWERTMNATRVIEIRMLDTERVLRLEWVTRGELSDLLPALQFFAREGRLPTREDEAEEPVAQKGSDG